MYHNFIVPESCVALWQECRSLVPGLVKNCAVKSQNLTIDNDNPLDPQSKSVYLVKQGAIHELFDGQLIVIHETGDLVNADALAHHKVATYDTDFPTLVDEYDGQQFMDAIATDKTKFQIWNQYLSCLSQSYQLLMCHFSKQDKDYIPEFREYKKGEVIIQEDTEGDEVFTLLNGTVKVLKNNEEVGEIKKDEIFGAIAALTHTQRTATILATSDCNTLVAKSDNFRSILATRPDIVQKLIQDMARTIVSSNERIIELSKDKT
jgi:CRP/FNR family transcriptional regulator, cyclic AMP receptor protein